MRIKNIIRGAIRGLSVRSLKKQERRETAEKRLSEQVAHLLSPAQKTERTIEYWSDRL
jgi:hypothetical protein